MDPKKLAQTALELMAHAAIQATDENLAQVQACRSMLKAIVSGDFVIVTAAQPQGNAPPPAGAIDG